MTDFSKASTSTLGKITFENEWLNHRILQADENDITIGLCGAPDGVDRHLANVFGYGYGLDKTVIVDHDKKVIDALIDNIPAPVTLKHGDFLDIIATTKDPIGLVDFDGTQVLSRETFTLIDICYTSNVKQLLIVAPTRNTTKGKAECLKVAEELDLPFGWHREMVPAKLRPVGYCSNYQKLTWKRPGPWDTLLEYAKRVAKAVETTSYTGKSPMKATLLTF